MGKHNTSTRRMGVVPRSNGLFALIGIGFFFLLAAQAGGSDKHIAVAAVVLFLACSIGRAPAQRLGERLSIPVLAVFAYLLLNGAASLYSRFGSFAGTEFSKILAALCVYGVVLVPAEPGCRRGQAAGRPLLPPDGRAGLSVPVYVHRI